MNGWKNPASKAKNATRQMYLKLAFAFESISFNAYFEFYNKINF